MLETLAIRVEDFLLLALFFGPPLALVFFAHGRIRKKKKSIDPRERTGLAAWRVLFFGISIFIAVIAYGLATYTPHSGSDGTALGLLLSGLWIMTIFLVIPLAILVRGIEWLEFRTRRENWSRLTHNSGVAPAASPATRGPVEE